MKPSPGDPCTTILNALQGMNKYLAAINGRIEVLLLSDAPEYMRSDMMAVYQAERELSRIVRSLTIYCHKAL